MAAAVDGFIFLAQQLEDRVLEPVLAGPEMAWSRLCHQWMPEWTRAFSEFLATRQSPLSRHLPLMNPFHVVALIACYLLICLGGQAVMGLVVRKKLDVKWIANAHNAFLVWLSAYMLGTILYEAVVNRGYTLFRNPNETSMGALQLAKYTWLFYFSKVFEFGDTFLMVAKQNFHQISFLHVYHHSSIFLIWWLVIFMAPVGEAYFSAVLNCFIHVIMYSYYFMSSVGIGKPLVRAMKPFITMGQMTQFCCNMFQASYDMVMHYSNPNPQADEYPISLTILLWVYMWTMLGLFGDFYVRSYLHKSAKSKTQ